MPNISQIITTFLQRLKSLQLVKKYSRHIQLFSTVIIIIALICLANIATKQNDSSSSLKNQTNQTKNLSEKGSNQDQTKHANQKDQDNQKNSSGKTSVLNQKDQSGKNNSLDNNDYLNLLKKIVKNPINLNPSQDELDNAEIILGFANQAQESINTGWLAQGDLIAFFIRVYLGEWDLALLPKIKEDKNQAKMRLLPPEDLFSAETRTYLVENLDKMLTSIDVMLNTYGELVKYVLDETTQDEGLAGKKLAKKILQHYENFKEGRENYFGVIDEESKTAEDLLLTNDPLRRQIMAARSMFALFQDASWALTQEKSRTVTRDIQQKLTQVINYASEPPFRGKPLIEKSYRDFLKKVKIYNDILTLGNEEGFYPETRQNLNDSLANCRQAYNDFAKMLNQSK